MSDVDLVCVYCAGRGGRYRLVYSRFLGTDAQVHQGPWERCWKCGGSGQAANEPADIPGQLALDEEQGRP